MYGRREKALRLRVVTAHFAADGVIIKQEPIDTEDNATSRVIGTLTPNKIEPLQADENNNNNRSNNNETTSRNTSDSDEVISKGLAAASICFSLNNCAL